MTVYHKPALHASMLEPDPLAPETTVYWDQSTGAQQPGAGGPVVASRIWYDNTVSLLQADNVQDALDLIDNQLDNITGASSSLDARVTILEAEMDTAQANIMNLQGRMSAAEANVVNLQAADTNLQNEIDALDVRVTANENSIVTNTAGIANLQGRMTTAEGNVTNLQGRMTTAEGNITSLQGRMTTAEADVVALQDKTGQATEATAGIAKIATTALVNAGADDATVITPLKLTQKLSSYTVNAATETVAGIAEIATQAEVSAGTDDARFITPKKLAAWSTAGPYVLKIGDTMTGPLNIATTVDQPNADLRITNSVSHARLYIVSNGAVSTNKQAILLMQTPEGKYSWGCANDTFFVWDYQRNATALNIAASNVSTNRALGVMRAPTPGQHLHVNYTGDVYACVETDSANIAVLRARTPQTDYGWCASGTSNTLYLWDYKRGVSPLSLDTSVLAINQPFKVYNTSYANIMVETATNYWARLGLKNTLRNWNVNVEPTGKFFIQDESVGAVRMAIDTGGAASFGSTAPAARLHVYYPGFTELRLEAAANDQSRVMFLNTQRNWMAGNIGNEFQVWDGTAGVKRFAIDANGNCYAGLNGAYLNASNISTNYISCSGHIDASVYVWAGQYVSTPYLAGGPGNAGTLQGYGPQNKFCFRWDGTSFYVRIDEVQERRISIV